MEIMVQLLARPDCCKVLPQQPYFITDLVRHGLDLLVVMLCHIKRRLLIGGFELAPHCYYCLGPFVGRWDIRSLVLQDFAYCLLNSWVLPC